MKRLVQSHLTAFRAALVIGALVLPLSEIGATILIALVAFCVPGLIIRVVFNQGKRRSNEVGSCLRFSIFFLLLEYIWKGFEKQDFLSRMIRCVHSFYGYGKFRAERLLWLCCKNPINV